MCQVVFIRPKHSIFSYFKLVSVSEKSGFNLLKYQKGEFRVVFTKTPFVSITH